MAFALKIDELTNAIEQLDLKDEVKLLNIISSDINHKISKNETDGAFKDLEDLKGICILTTAIQNDCQQSYI